MFDGSKDFISRLAQWRYDFTADALGPLLLTRINFNPSMDKKSYIQKSVRWNYLSNLKLTQQHHLSLGMNK